jgi:hypothetical protein
MVIFKDSRRFEITVDEDAGEWLVKFYEYVPGRLVPTRHLHHRCVTRQAAIDTAVRKWHVLFPDAAALVWREPPLLTPHSRGQKGPSRPER